MRGDKAAVRKLVEQHADVNAPQADGATALHWAVFRSDKEMVDLLIRAGANAEGREPRGRHAAVAGERQRRCRHHRSADQGRSRSQREASSGQDSSDGSVAHRQCRCDEGAARPRRGRECEGNPARNHSVDVGRGRRPCACDQASDRARRGYQGPLESGRARKRTGARKIERSQKAGRGAGCGAALPDKRRRHWAQVALQRQQGAAVAAAAVAAAAAAGAGAAAAQTVRIRRRILQTMPQPPRSALAEPAADKRR